MNTEPHYRSDPRQLSMPVGKRLVAFWAPAPQSGKTTAANALMACTMCYSGAGELGERASFAYPLRVSIAAFLEALSVDPYVIYSRVWEGIDKELPIPGVGKSFVELAIMFGTTVGREWIGEDVWVDAYRRTATCFLAQPSVPLVVTDDMRFPNEARAVRELGGVLIGIRRPGAEVSSQRAAAEGRLSFDDMDCVVENNTGRAIFEARVVQAARHLGVDL